MVLKKIAIYCRQCHQVDILPDFPAFHDFVNRKWDLVWQEMDDNHKYNVSSQKIVGAIKLRDITPKQLRNMLKDKEYLEFACRSCFFMVTKHWYLMNGYDVLSEAGVVICNRSYYDQHKDEVIELAKRMRRQ
jgi:hypothetical protein